MIKAVVFDMDGLMFDTEKLTYEIIRETMIEDGYEYSLDFYKTTVGKRSVDVVKLYKEKYGENFDYFLLREKNMKKFWAYTEKNGVPIKEGLYEILDFLKAKNIKIALATSTTEKSAKEILKRGKVIHFFDALICGDSVEKGKPAPDIFIKASQTLGFDVKDCLALEDSFNGIISASSAGLVTVMVPDLIEPTNEIKKLCYKVCKNLKEVITLIKQEEL